MLKRQALQILAGGILALVTYGCQVYNSSSNDGAGVSAIATPTPNPADPGAVRYAAAYAVISANCLNCHTYTHSFTNYAEADYISNSMAVPQSLPTSCLYVKLKGAGESLPPSCPTAALGADMPYGLPQLSSADLGTIATWINGIGQ